jgi:hypothetical protein
VSRATNSELISPDVGGDVELSKLEKLWMTPTIGESDSGDDRLGRHVWAVEGKNLPADKVTVILQIPQRLARHIYSVYSLVHDIDCGD